MVERTQISIRVPKDIVKDLKIIAIKEETTMSSIILDLMEDYITQYKNKYK
jgi:metal-responsive CopG/Arc/MetJ family transcriptional regulator